MARFNRPNIGSIGTQGYTTGASLVASFIGELRQQQPLHQRDKELLRAFDENKLASPLVGKSIAVLVEALARYAPKGYHFGPSTSDPTDFGYWPDEEHGRNEGSVEAEQRREAEETIAEETAEQFIFGEK